MTFLTNLYVSSLISEEYLQSGEMQTCYIAFKYFLVNFMESGWQLKKNRKLLLETVTLVVK